MIPQELQNKPFSEQKEQAKQNVLGAFTGILTKSRREMVEAHLLGKVKEFEAEKALVLTLEAKRDRLLALLEKQTTIEPLCEILGKITLHPDREF